MGESRQMANTFHETDPNIDVHSVIKILHRSNLYQSFVHFNTHILCTITPDKARIPAEAQTGAKMLKALSSNSVCFKKNQPDI
jgi:hypothetical protein